MATMIRPSWDRSSTLAKMLATAMLFSACSSAPAVESLGGSTAAVVPPSSTPVQLPRNGAVLFSRAIPPSIDGLPIDAVIQEVDREGAVGSVLVQGAAYRAAPSWAPDGREFAFLGSHGISVRHAGDTRLLVACHPQACSGLGAPSWSPTDSSIAFFGEIDGEEGLFQVSPDSGQPSSIASGLAVRGAPAWSPDGTQLAAIVTEGRSTNLQILDAGSGQVHRTIDVPGLDLGEAVAWSPDGATLAFEVTGSEQGEHQGIYLLTLDGADTRLLTACPDAGCVDLIPSFSPDGTSVVFTRARCDEPGSDCFVGDVWTIRTDGGGAHALTQGSDLDCCAAWRPIPR